MAGRSDEPRTTGTNPRSLRRRRLKRFGRSRQSHAAHLNTGNEPVLCDATALHRDAALRAVGIAPVSSSRMSVKLIYDQFRVRSRAANQDRGSSRPIAEL